ncbi:MAG TPA: LysR family transcriptional regulator, partial [Mycobacteriales bacterium]|nr:LysR family transcriptional regulator [Mycobacteriales bacterium]
MELRHLHYFLAVAEERHFGRAAERLHMAQPPLSHAVKQLEGELGVTLFERTTRRVELTPAAELFLQRVRGILAAVESAKTDVARAEAGVLGRIALGFTGSVTYELLPRLSRVLREELPDVELELFGEMLTPRSVAGLVDGSLDLAFLRPPVRQAGLAVHVIRREPLIAVLPEQHALARSQTVPLGGLAEEPFVFYPSHFRSVVHDAVLNACRNAGFEPRQKHEVGETSTLVAFVAAGLGVALVPASVRHLQITGAVYRPLADTTEEVALALAFRSDDESVLLRRVLACVHSLVGWPRRASASVSRPQPR